MPPDRAPGAGTWISVSISPGAIDVWNVSTRKSPIGTSRSPFALFSTTLAPSASITEPRSPEGSAWESEPPIVPRFRTSGSAICGAAEAIVG